MGGFISINLMAYGIITSFLLPILFYDKLSIYFLSRKESRETVENLKNLYDESNDISKMNRVLRKIFSYENYLWISN
jgi:hypothetical protein